MTERPASSGIDELRIILEDRVNQDDNQDQNSVKKVVWGTEIFGPPDHFFQDQNSLDTAETLTCPTLNAVVIQRTFLEVLIKRLEPLGKCMSSFVKRKAYKVSNHLIVTGSHGYLNGRLAERSKPLMSSICKPTVM